MLKFECKCGNLSKWWNLSKKGRMIKCWYFTAKVEIDQYVAVWLKNKELIRILKFEDSVGNRSKCWNLSTRCAWSKCWNLSEKWEIDQNVEIWVQNAIVNQNVEIWVQMWESIKMMKFERKKGRLIEKGRDQMFIFYCKSGNRSKCWNLKKQGIDQKFEDKIGNWSKCWNLSANHQIDQNVDIWVKSGESIKKLKFGCKGGIHQNVEIKWKVGNRSKYWNLGVRGDWSNCRNLSAKWQINQNVEI